MDIIIRDVEEKDGQYKIYNKDGTGGHWYITKESAEIISSQPEPQVMLLPIKDEISQKLVDRLNMFEKQMASDYGFANKQKISYKIKELKKCIQIVQLA